MPRVLITVEFDAREEEFGKVGEDDLREFEDMMQEAVGTWDLPGRKIKAEIVR